MDALRADVADHRVPFVWVDDDAISTRAWTWAECGHPCRYLFVEPQPNRGLSRAEVERTTRRAGRHDMLARWISM